MAKASPRRPRWRNPHVWFGLAVTVLFGWLALRDVDLAEVQRSLAKADWVVLLTLSIPGYVLLLWVRALRWRHLTDPIRPMPLGALFRAMAVGFMANNIFPAAHGGGRALVDPGAGNPHQRRRGLRHDRVGAGGSTWLR